MARVELVGVTKHYGGRPVVDDLHLTIDAGELVSILAPPNHGKTTLLRLIAGLESLDEGDVVVDGISVVGVPVQTRGVGMVFEDLAIFPHWTGFDNLAHPLRRAGHDDPEVKRRVSEVASQLHIEHILDRKPPTYSGGEQQRVAIGRAIIRRPALLLMDQPLTDLDAQIRHEMAIEIRNLQQEIGQTTIYGTHDFEEAMAMSDRVVVLDHGKVVQDGTPEQVFDWPASEHVAISMGNPEINLLTCSVVRGEGSVTLTHEAFACDAGDWGQHLGDREEVRLGIRPEETRLLAPEQSVPAGFGSARGAVEVVQYLGHERIVDVDIGGERLKHVGPAEHSLGAGDPVVIAWPLSAMRLFDASTTDALGDGPASAGSEGLGGSRRSSSKEDG